VISYPLAGLAFPGVCLVIGSKPGSVGCGVPLVVIGNCPLVASLTLATMSILAVSLLVELAQCQGFTALAAYFLHVHSLPE